MKFKQTQLTLLVTAALGIGTCLTLIAWSDTPANDSINGFTYHDTIPSKKRNTPEPKSADRDFDKELRDLENAVRDLDDLPENIHDNIKKEIEESFKNIDFGKIRLQAEQAFSKVDMEKLKKEIAESMDKIDFSELEKDIKKSLKDLPDDIDIKIRKELENVDFNKEWKKDFDEQHLKQSLKEIEKIDFKNFEKEMADVKKAMDKISVDLEKIDFKKDWKGMSKDLEKLKEELKSYQTLVYELEKDGLLNTKEDYKINYKDGELLINGKKQPASVTDKYKKYFKKNITITKEDGDIDLDSDKEFD